jgi:alcohol dehydrogenase (cytochrome c)
MPNDQWDFDWAFERQIVPLRAAGGQTKKFVVTSGKPGIYDAVEADTGKYAFSVDMGLQNFVTSIDPATGAKRVDPNLIPGTGQPIVVCPHAGGGRSWIPGAINPDTKMLFVPAVETCMNLIPTPAGGRGFLSTAALRLLVLELQVLCEERNDFRFESLAYPIRVISFVKFKRMLDS